MSPNVSNLHPRKVHHFDEPNAQGITYAYGDVWFLSSEKALFEYKGRYDGMYTHFDKRSGKLTFADLNRYFSGTGIKFDSNHYNHIGDIDYYEELLFLPIEYKDKRLKSLIIALSTSFELVAYALLHGQRTKLERSYRLPPHASEVAEIMRHERDWVRRTPGESLDEAIARRMAIPDGYSEIFYDYSAAWCAVNPHNGLLYTAGTGKVTYLNAWDVSEFYSVFSHKDQWGKRVNITLLKDQRIDLRKTNGSPDEVDSIQGVVFSPDDNSLYLARYRSEGYLFFFTRWHNYIYAYDALTGKLIGRSKEFNFKGVGDEIEGITIYPSGATIFVVVCINGINDIFEIHAFEEKGRGGGGGGGSTSPDRPPYRPK
jgi:hypothetical protein